ncbi:putative oxidase protein [Lasiodiplodia theobromae]|nr:putative oxidase protein [Lasiodiplodia theobromae]
MVRFVQPWKNVCAAHPLDTLVSGREKLTTLLSVQWAPKLQLADGSWPDARAQPFLHLLFDCDALYATGGPGGTPNSCILVGGDNQIKFAGQRLVPRIAVTPSARLVEDIHKRVIGDGYTIAGFLADVLDHAIRDQRLLSVGGNTGKPSTFTLIDIDTLTGGTFDATTLLEGNNLECFVF